jgi:hypothetical protein
VWFVVKAAEVAVYPALDNRTQATLDSDSSPAVDPTAR